MPAAKPTHDRRPLRPLASLLRSARLPTSNVHWQHLAPPWPVVAPAIPDAQGVPDALAPQQVGQPLVVAVVRVVAADRKDDVQVPQLLQAPRLMLVRQVQDRV